MVVCSRCLLSDPTKQSKLKGMKKFLAYQLTSTIPSASGVPLRSSSSSGGGGAIVVQRRYKHFDWLYDRLRERYPIVCIPPLPDKQVTGRYEADFIHKRMCRLQHWVSVHTSYQGSTVFHQGGGLLIAVLHSSLKL